MLCVFGTFRIAPDRVPAARDAMARVIACSLAEEGCLAYSYAEDVVEPGLIRVQELWDSRDALDRHFAAPHMQAWLEQRAALGFCDRRIGVAEIGRPAPL